MNKSVKGALFAGLIVFSLLGAKIVLFQEHDDQVLVKEALAEALKSSREGKPGGVLDKLSASLKVNDSEMTVSGGQVADFIRDQKPDIEVVDPRPTVIGDEARIESPVRLKLGLFGASVEKELKKVVLVFHKENGRQYLIFPTQKWRLTDVRIADTAISDLLQ